MSGFLALAAIGTLAFAALVLLRVPRMLWSLCGAALFLGAAGYAWQGRPALAARPATARSEAIVIDPAMVALRERLMGRFTADTAYLTASDAMLRAGDSGAATQVVLGGIRAIPRSYILWTALGTNLSIHDGGRVSPTAAFAFAQAARLAPRHPAPFYYAGLARIGEGDATRGLALWRRAVSLSAPRSDYRARIAAQAQLIERLAAAGTRR